MINDLEEKLNEYDLINDLFNLGYNDRSLLYDFNIYEDLDYDNYYLGRAWFYNYCNLKSNIEYVKKNMKDNYYLLKILLKDLEVFLISITDDIFKGYKYFIKHILLEEEFNILYGEKEYKHLLYRKKLTKEDIVAYLNEKDFIRYFGIITIEDVVNEITIEQYKDFFSIEDGFTLGNIKESIIRRYK